MRDRVYWIFSLAVFLLVGFIWWWIGYRPARAAALESRSGATPLEQLGTYGDSFGAINSLFSALALTGVAIGLAFQHREHVVARREAEEARIEADKDRDHASELTMLAAVLNAQIEGAKLTHELHRRNMEAIPKPSIQFEEYKRQVGEELVLKEREINELMQRAYHKLGIHRKA